MNFTDRQQRELEYHKEFSRQSAAKITLDVPMEVMNFKRRRWWNAYWHTYTLIRSMNLTGKRVLVAGCGFGDDAIRIARAGGIVDACDLSPDVLDIARARAEHFAVPNIQFSAMPLEAMTYPADSFDMIILIDVLHHCNIPAAMREASRVVKPGGTILGSELYTHSWMQAFRNSWFIDKWVYPRMIKFIYNSDQPYITEDEHKVDENEFDQILDHLDQPRLDWFNIVIGRLIPDRHPVPAAIDRTLLRGIGGFGKFAAARVVFFGMVKKQPQ